MEKEEQIVGIAEEFVKAVLSLREASEEKEGEVSEVYVEDYDYIEDALENLLGGEHESG